MFCPETVPHVVSRCRVCVDKSEMAGVWGLGVRWSGVRARHGWGSGASVRIPYHGMGEGARRKVGVCEGEAWGVGGEGWGVQGGVGVGTGLLCGWARQRFAAVQCRLSSANATCMIGLRTAGRALTSFPWVSTTVTGTARARALLCRNPRNHCPSGAYQTS